MAKLETVHAALTLFDTIWPRDMTPKAVADRARAYELALRHLSDAEVTTAAVLCSRSCRFYPVPADLIASVRPASQIAIEATANADRAYDEILSRYERGHQVGPRDIEEALGPEAAHAFCCAGGTAVFAWCEPGRDEGFRRKRFMEGYVEAFEDSQAQRDALEAGKAMPQQLNRAEAATALKLIKAKLDPKEA